MFDKDSKGISYTAGFFMLIAFAIAGVIMAEMITRPIWYSMTGIDSSKKMEVAANPDYRNAFRVSQTIIFLVGFLLPAFVTAWVLNRKPVKLVGLSYHVNWKQVGLVCLIMFTALYASSAFSYFTKEIPIAESLRQQFDKMENDYLQQAAAIIGLSSFGEFILALVIMAFLPALCEEVLFRGGLQNYLTRATRKPWISIIIVSILFSLLHFSYYGFLSRMFLGIVLGFIFEYSGRLWLCVIAHFLNNALVVVLTYIQVQQGRSIIEVLKSNEGSWVGILALPITIVLLIVFKKIGNKPEEIPGGAVRNEELRNTPFY